MKRLVLIIAAIAAFAFSSFAQLTASDSRGISIQGIARDNNGGIYASKPITVVITVYNGPSVVYKEKQTGIMTDIAGVFSTNIGIAPLGVTLTVSAGTAFSAVDFNAGSLSITVGVQIESGVEVNVGTFPLQSVPYAKLATMATNASNATNAIHATNADNATHATNADNATNASHATTADNGVPIGTIISFAGYAAPAGWAICDGSSHSIYDLNYAGLWSVTSYTWGGCCEHFNLPDLRGRFLRGVSDTTTNDPDKASRTALYGGGTTGNSVATYQGDSYASHQHIDGFAGGNATASYGVATVATVGNVNGQSGTSTINHAYTSFSGSSETRPKNATVLFIIKCK